MQRLYDKLHHSFTKHDSFFIKALYNRAILARRSISISIKLVLQPKKRDKNLVVDPQKNCNLKEEIR
ncbi:hypothetical protein [Coleofasciculus sp. G2-EDA-02]|uniref:hypothetical protein n=1 Tax=Coleofasciculus sp. G2-EDA-02 TaxID=3069529 RepID=UPI0032F7AAD2